VDRHGKVRFYFRQRGRKPVPLPAPDSADFLTAYHSALKDLQEERPQSLAPKGSLRELIEHWYKTHHFTKLEGSTQAVYRRLLERMRSAPYAGNPIDQLHQRHVRAIVAKEASASTTANRMLRLLHQLCQHAIELGWIDADPTNGVKRIASKSKGIHSWTDDEIAGYESQWPPGTRPRLALALLLFTGQRRSDVVRMGPADVSGMAIRVHQQKTGAALVIPLHADLRREIDAAPPGQTFLMTDRGAPYSVNGFYNSFVDWCQAAGLPAGCSPHGLRKAAARRLAEAGCTTHQIAAITGHKTLAEVARYTRAVDQKNLARDAMALMTGLSNPDEDAQT